eukprot:CAMPEP_0195003818 /NCGR_PEP_ID=MMETSP0326_2-20130528/3777_1 /TAXON_ID=2866 ORGANISM="Crypthecodinium cohnii, Strain Seligo" /NCGR_SAMPLE_ID=MMETSP0326_2 /ASSEMBLY_ACC=CAM_ASM_000348 /LENGTH=137 /DNA_ID=CAMNT_0040008279 /DNA_START=471 /DNA_END=884 /DNA_ORIENTATION=+
MCKQQRIRDSVKHEDEGKCDDKCDNACDYDDGSLFFTGLRFLPVGVTECESRNPRSHPHVHNDATELDDPSCSVENSHYLGLLFLHLLGSLGSLVKRPPFHSNFEEGLLFQESDVLSVRLHYASPKILNDSAEDVVL